MRKTLAISFLIISTEEQKLIVARRRAKDAF